jgi:peptide/nickel transport system ATP-binding protein
MTEAGIGATPLLDVRDLGVLFRGTHAAVNGVDLTLRRGEVLGLVGESGSGKSLTMLAVLGLTPASAVIRGSARLNGEELVGAAPRRLRQIRGARIGMIFQDPLSALNPVLSIGAQIAEAVRLHRPEMSRAALRDRVVELLDLVAVPQPELRLGQYPHEFSGGMRQRVMIAMAIANDPDLLIADEPTTALDVTVQAQIMELLKGLRVRLGIGMVLVTHDLGVVAGAADRVAVMYGGRIVETGVTDDVFYGSHHPYTRGLLASLPTLDGGAGDLVPIPGNPPTLGARPGGCSFHPRCRWAEARCRTEVPEPRSVGAVRSACHLAERLDETAPAPVPAI